MENVDIRLLREIADLETTPRGLQHPQERGAGLPQHHGQH